MSDLLLLGSFLRITSWLFSWDTLRFKIIRQQNLGKQSNVISACFFRRMPNGFCLHFVTVPKPVSSGFSPCAALLVIERWVSLLLLSSGKHQGKLPVMPLLEVVKDYHNNNTSEVYDKIPTHLKKYYPKEGSSFLLNILRKSVIVHWQWSNSKPKWGEWRKVTIYAAFRHPGPTVHYMLCPWVG